MAVDYDLVIIGNTHTARIAAVEAIEWPARVALVLPPAIIPPYAHIYPHALQQASNQGFHRDPQYPWHYAKNVADRLNLQLSTATLAAKGIDIVEGSGEFSRKPKLCFNIDQRCLRAKKYLLAMGSQLEVPDQIPGLVETGFLTIATLGSILDRPKVPSRWAIIGDEAIGVEMAQALRKLGYEVMLIVESSHILPEEDPDTATAVQFQLEASGIVLMTNKTIREVGVDEDGKYVNIERHRYHIDEILLAATEQPHVSSFGLGGVRVEYDLRGVGVDEYLQTSHHRIYACGSICGKVLGGYYGEHLAEYEALLAVNNALSNKKKPVNYHKIPWTIFSNPQVARVGPTELDARSQFKQRLVVLRAEYSQSQRVLISESDNGFVKLMVRRSGQILGATIVGQDAAEMMQIVSLAIRNKLRVDNLSDFPGISLTNTYSILEAARQWKQPSWWLRVIDPICQWLSECRRSIGGFFSQLRPRRRSRQPKVKS